MTKLLVPPGTEQFKLIQFGVQQVENGVVVTKVALVTEAGRPPYQVQQTFVFKDMSEALEDVRKDL